MSLSEKAPADTLLSLDMSPSDCLYRIRRSHEGEARVIYVKLLNLDIVPEEKQTYGPSLINVLKSLNHWEEDWNTLAISKDGPRIRCQMNAFAPHQLREEQAPGDYKRYNVLEIEIVRHLKSRVFRVLIDAQQCILKLAPFAYELEMLANEIAIYHTLTSAKSGLAPRLLGYVFEERGKRVVGFLLEDVQGRFPTKHDLQICRGALRQLHSLNIIHGDLNRYNVIIATDGPKFIDFECSHTGDQLDAQQAQEMNSLQDALQRDTSSGRPWTDD